MTELVSPYAEADAEWLRGSLHTHTTRSDGDLEMETLLDAYESRGYDFLAVTDHDRLFVPNGRDPDTSMTLLAGVEVSDRGPHVVLLGAEEAIEPTADRQRVIDAAACQEALAVLAHPRWGGEYEHVSQGELSLLDGYDAIEVYNGVGRRGYGSPLATEQWDRLLSAGRRVWGLGTDDAHRPTDVGNAWTVVRAADRRPASILAALGAGRCYASTGVTIETIAVADGEIRVETPDADTVRLVSDLGAIQRTVDGPSARFAVPEDLVYHDEHTYVRVECLGPGEAVAWTQPVWIE